jgi:hypothetical protein
MAEDMLDPARGTPADEGFVQRTRREYGRYQADPNLIHNRDLHRRILEAWRQESPEFLERLTKAGIAEEAAFVAQQRMWEEQARLVKAGVPWTDAQEQAERTCLMLGPDLSEPSEGELAWARKEAEGVELMDSASVIDPESANLGHHREHLVSTDDLRAWLIDLRDHPLSKHEVSLVLHPRYGPENHEFALCIEDDGTPRWWPRRHPETLEKLSASDRSRWFLDYLSGELRGVAEMLYGDDVTLRRLWIARNLCSILEEIESYRTLPEFIPFPDPL